MKVIKKFIDKHTKQVYKIGSTYKHDNQERISELVERGFIKEGSSKMSDPSLLSGNVKQVQKRLDDCDAETLNTLLIEEKEGLNRKGITEYIEKMI